MTSQLASISNGSYSIDGGGTNKPIVVSPSTGDTNVKNEDMVRAIVGRMKRLGAQWSTLNPKETNDKLHKQAAVEAAKLDQYGVHATFRGSDGTWWISRDELNPSNVGKKLHNCYHEGGFVDEQIPLGRREVPAILEKGELVLYALHLSAYTSDGAIAEEQLEMLFADMLSEYEKGNYTMPAGTLTRICWAIPRRFSGYPAPPTPGPSPSRPP